MTTTSHTTEPDLDPDPWDPTYTVTFEARCPHGFPTEWTATLTCGPSATTTTTPACTCPPTHERNHR